MSWACSWNLHFGFRVKALDSEKFHLLGIVDILSHVCVGSNFSDSLRLWVLECLKMREL